MMKLTAYFNELCSEFDHENCVRSSKKQYPYNLQHVEHSSKHAVFFSEEVQFSSRIIQPSLNHTVFLSKHQIPDMQCVINIEYCCQNVQWLMLITAFLEKKDCC
jgi:hypothetical protein